ncbi:hypothetical protein FSARC_10383 [Fusarium sarcochroum]|uniref:Uncharacterized protein n=1 Tax=Fusarium sarcochroum TaxID=1208366 RepID=A0A8H4X4J9_9HYPO|nr:hypothetical protein FSARC_10383 [Fusarium sarcochroum]
MKAQSILHALLASGVSGVALTKSTHDTSGNLGLDLDRGEIPTIQKDHGGWVNPEDLMPMPQCIAQQDQSSWLNAMTRCTRHRCTSHFGLICTHYQWLTQLSCLSVEFSPKTIERYVEYCSRSILAKAQLHHWIQYVTGRTWLVHVGDTNGLQSLSPESLRKGYGDTVDVANEAPGCLQNSVSSSKESFQHVMGSCSFTSETLHTGNAGRPWEYSTSRKSMVALSYDTVGYDVTKRHILSGQYFDKDCFCSTFAINQQHEPCSTSDTLALTKARLWLNATCGPASISPRPRDMIPWQWTLRPGIAEQEGECPSNEFKLGSIALVNLATLLALFFGNGRRHRDTATNPSTQSHSSRWILGGLLLASLQLLANLVNVKIIQGTPGYENIPIIQLILLWCSLPRLSWVTISPLKDLVSATSALFAEVVLQGFSLYYMTLTVNYGRQNGFYLGGLADAKEEGFAWLMYAGALIWLIVVAMMAVPFIRVIHTNLSTVSPASTKQESVSHHDDNMTPKDDEANVHETLLPKPHWGAPLSSEGSSYGTLPVEYQSHELSGGSLATLYMVMSIAMPFLWLAQWFFWAGFVVLSSEE